MVNQINQQTISVINRIIACLFLIISLILILQHVDKYLRIKAVDDCTKISRYEKQLPEENAKVFYPLTDIYKACLKDKGY